MKTSLSKTYVIAKRDPNSSKDYVWYRSERGNRLMFLCEVPGKGRTLHFVSQDAAMRYLERKI